MLMQRVIFKKWWGGFWRIGQDNFFPLKVFLDQGFFIIKGCLIWKVIFYLQLSIFIIQRAYIPKNGVNFCQQVNDNNNTCEAKSCDLVQCCQIFLWRN